MTKTTGTAELRARAASARARAGEAARAATAAECALAVLPAGPSTLAHVRMLAERRAAHAAWRLALVEQAEAEGRYAEARVADVGLGLARVGGAR